MGGQRPRFHSIIEIIRVDYDFLETMGLQLIKGGGFFGRKGF
jgi:hypothetical protein